MKIVVCIKQVPDSWADKKLQDGDSTLDRASVDRVLNELDEYAVEAALTLVEAQGGEITVLTMGPADAGEAIRRALSMGADAGIHLVDDGLHGSDAIATSYALAEVLKGQEFDLVMFGCESTDAKMSVIPAMVAERLSLPQLTFANAISVDGSTVKIQRVTDYGYDEVEATGPAVVSMVEKSNEPRYPSFKGIMAAKKKPVQTLSLAEAGLDANQVGLAQAWSLVDSFAARPPREKGTIVDDGGDGGVKIAEYLSTQKFI
jgi:electron transfer flavoprotein beta subunit